MSTHAPTSSPTATQTPAPEENKWQDCTACRLTGAATLSGVGLYALYEAGQQGAFAKVRPKGGPRGAPITAAVGVGESRGGMRAGNPGRGTTAATRSG
ncbi:hypothetical protein CC85DRAFT_287435 [Cutaneotrichosporon oleaginosum]|uniref:Distal membrane-arm assembly complex protein 1-like domain-containing protein n=1 Tax=Cutaneotrichosporon oleaginosum TaxID=879819 RepID=A0A0J0XHH7_9TREE|nr:uncharacterized protein CC85DRAFT_287435 [Cutaneotrichosporon oleaginosum]KLT40462.1 hypothetical protein CC85DRAFT_287435 [Cutaneotrichosporon oleaginosum]TXT15345.1 hypothetical protein COLE_01538 [Cutaneotrichosporon oleaginosum]